VFPLKHRQFHGMLLPFFNDPAKEAELTYGNIQKCSIFSHHIDSTIFYQRWEHAYKDFDHIRKTAIINTKKYIGSGYMNDYDYDYQNEAQFDAVKKTLLLTSSDIPPKLCDILFHRGDHRDCDVFHIPVLKKLEFLRYIYQNCISVIIISPLIKQRYKTNFILEDLLHKKNIDAADYNYSAPGLKIISDHAVDIKYYFPKIKIIYEESTEDVCGEYELSPLFYSCIDVMRISKTRYDKVYKHKLMLSKKYGVSFPIVEIIQSD
jgi:hypothetical protein